jgi:glycosyltransferase involved in cell wall biosynthesis
VPEVAFAVPGDLNTPTGGYIYDRRVIELLPHSGWQVRHIELPGDYPAPGNTSLQKTEQLLAALSRGMLLVIDGLAFGAMPAALVDRIKQRIVALVHHPLAKEAGIAAARAADLARSERAALARAIHVIVTSDSTADLLVREFEVPAEKISVAEPGTEPARRARGADGPPRLLSVGSVTAHKGFDVLMRALAQISDLPWQSRIVGSLDRDPAMVTVVRDAAASAPLTGRIVLRGALDQGALAEEYDAARLFVLASHFEGYGMAFAEALARGLPIVACAGGAVTSTVPADAGLLVPPGDTDALAAALRRLLSNPAELARRAEAAWRHAERLPRWRETAQKFAAALDRADREKAA